MELIKQLAYTPEKPNERQTLVKTYEGGEGGWAEKLEENE